jgi:dTDP-glucose pyrophosphorylase
MRNALPATAKLRDAVEALERSRTLICALVDAEGHLLGVLSDGDVRRALLAGHGLDVKAADVMTRTPVTGPAEAAPAALREIMQERRVAAIPLVDAAGRFVDIAQLADIDTDVPTGGEAFDFAVIMAGGEGRRLRPLTLDRPKPMIEIAGTPLLERQVCAMVASGLKRIFIATNYLGHMIEAHFGDGSAMGARIEYLRESEKMGTAGALSLLAEAPTRPILVVNGDVLTTSDFGHLCSFHHEERAFATVAAILYRVEVPFGVLHVEGKRLHRIEEKPLQRFLCNAGMYVLSPEALALVPKDKHYDMTELLEAALAADKRVGVFPVHEYWSDIGNPSDLEKAVATFENRKTERT